ncbi:hypothetical protein Llala01_01991 [Lactococcus lactis subsp. lactis]|nr:hypothetical protein C5L15_001967 [Lactococcus lactis subsp. lactis]
MPYAKITYLPVDKEEDAEWCDKKASYAEVGRLN